MARRKTKIQIGGSLLKTNDPQIISNVSEYKYIPPIAPVYNHTTPVEKLTSTWLDFVIDEEQIKVKSEPDIILQPKIETNKNTLDGWIEYVGEKEQPQQKIVQNFVPILKPEETQIVERPRSYTPVGRGHLINQQPRKSNGIKQQMHSKIETPGYRDGDIDWVRAAAKWNFEKQEQTIAGRKIITSLSRPKYKYVTDLKALDHYSLRWTVIDANLIYNMCQPGSVIAPIHWNKEELAERERAARIYEEKFNETIGFYTRLEKSIIEEGFRNPIIITAGVPRWRQMNEIDPEYRKKPQLEWLLCEFIGGSRLTLAQRKNWFVPVLVSDWVNRFPYAKKLNSINEIKNCFMDPPDEVFITQRGLKISPPKHTHLPTGLQDPTALSAIRRDIIQKDIGL